MMKFEMVKELDEEKFRRLTGVKRTTFDKMVAILEQSIKGRKTNKGRKKETQHSEYATYDLRVYSKV